MRTVDVVMAQAKRINILIIKVNKLFSFFSLRCFSSYRNTRESFGELEKAVDSARVPTAFRILPNFHSFF